MNRKSLLSGSWTIGGLTLVLIAAIAISSASRGEIAVRAGDLELTVRLREEGGIRLSFMRAR